MIERDSVHMDEFYKLSLSETHYIDIRHCFIEGVFNPSHVLDYFGRYSGLDCIELWKQVIDLIKQDLEYWVHVASVVLPLRPQNFDDWLMQMESPLTPCDEMFLFILSKVHFHHTVVYNLKRPWCTIQSFEPLPDDIIYAECNLHLIFLGQDMYGEVIPLLDLPKVLCSPLKWVLYSRKQLLR